MGICIPFGLSQLSTYMETAHMANAVVESSNCVTDRLSAARKMTWIHSQRIWTTVMARINPSALDRSWISSWVIRGR